MADALEVLVDAHLLESPAPDRYRLHDLLRAYAADRARADEPPQAVEEAVRRVLDWYLRTADAAAGVVAPYRDRVPLDPVEPGGEPLAFATAEQALAWCEQERTNLVAATRQAAAQGLHDIAWKLPVAASVASRPPRTTGRSGWPRTGSPWPARGNSGTGGARPGC